MRFVALLAGLMAAVPVNATTVISGTLAPIDGVADFTIEDYVNDYFAPGRDTRVSFLVDSGNITAATFITFITLSWSIYNEGYPDTDVGNDSSFAEQCSLGANCDGPFPGYSGNYLTALPSTAQSFSYIARKPAAYNNCGTVFGVICAEYSRYGTYGNVQIASQSPVNYTLRFDTLNSVPEPASWAMMIAGFGLVGSMRRRQSRTAHCRASAKYAA
jgi:hypothetical protein